MRVEAQLFAESSLTSSGMASAPGALFGGALYCIGEFLLRNEREGKRGLLGLASGALNV